MPRALITLVCAICLGTMTICAAVGPAAGYPADHHPRFVEVASPPMSLVAITIL